VSQIPSEEGRLATAEGVVNLGQRVWVKVIEVTGPRISLTMREVDQETGEDLGSLPRAGEAPTGPGGGAFVPTGANAGGGVGVVSAASGPVEFEMRERLAALEAFDRDRAPRGVGVRIEAAQAAAIGARGAGRKRATSPERWEEAQLRSAGVLPPSHGEGFDPDTGELVDDHVEEEFELELNDAEPAFLKGQARQFLDLSPIRVARNMDGTMQAAAQAQAALTKERRELKQIQENELLDAIPKDLNRPWVDPLPAAGERHIAEDLRGFGTAAPEMPEWKRNVLGSNPTYGERKTGSMREQREGLPIFTLRKPLMDAIAANQFMVVLGETGSGKTTQMTQYLREDGYSSKHGGSGPTGRRRIGCTQPRRVAAMSVAKRVAEECGCILGEEVGYSIRFEDCTSAETEIKYMTDGMLLRECLLDPTLSQYSVIVLDEAHERTIHTDVLFGLCKAACSRRPDLKVIVTSATLEAEKFSEYFVNAPIFTIPGRLFPVEILYAREPETDYLDAALTTVIQIHLMEPPGDILLFLTGQEEIDSACEILFDRMKALPRDTPTLEVLPIYSALPSEMQTRIFEPAPEGGRKCVIATNIAETSLTIDGIYYVVDPGFSKQKIYNPRNGMDALVVSPISQAAARQRAGRAGRTGPGKCYRLYTEAAYRNEMLASSVPEIQRTNLSNTVLTLKAMGINDLLSFDFMDPPPVQTMISAMEALYQLGALDDEGLLTRLGKQMAEFPLEPQMSKCLITSVGLSCSEEIVTVLAMLSIQSVFYRPKDKASIADQRKARFHAPEGDHMTLLQVYESWVRNGCTAAWCHENYIQARSLQRAQDVRKQIVGLMDRHRMDLVSCGKDLTKVRLALCSAFFTNVARKDPTDASYKTIVENQVVYVHPSSAIFQKAGDWVLYHEVTLTTKEYMRTVTMIDPRWLAELAPRFFKLAAADQMTERKRRQKIEPLFDPREQIKGEWRISRAKKVRN
jgi:ATP-dependent RNA helicase DHX8/PRP22